MPEVAPFAATTMPRASLPSAYITRNSQKKMIWFTTSVTAPDQLRQRVAWALSQIFSLGRQAFVSHCCPLSHNQQSQKLSRNMNSLQGYQIMTTEPWLVRIFPSSVPLRSAHPFSLLPFSGQPSTIYSHDMPSAASKLCSKKSHTIR